MADPTCRRLHYIRYADDWRLGFAGPKAEADEIQAKRQSFLRHHLNLELCTDKTLITHAGDKAARFLGHEISSRHADDERDQRDRRSVNRHIMLKVPWDAIRSMCSRYARRGTPDSRTQFIDDADFSIIGRCGSELRGYVNYYLLAHNVDNLYRLKWTMGDLDAQDVGQQAHEHRDTHGGQIPLSRHTA
jgi:hypothetical protein